MEQQLELSRMSNQELLAFLGPKEYNKYHGPYKRRSDMYEYYPVITRHQADIEQALRAEKALNNDDSPLPKSPKESIIPTASFKKRPKVKKICKRPKLDTFSCSNSREKRFKTSSKFVRVR
jgi:hypothetical protein